MKIIRQGCNPQSEQTYRCKYCDCIFEVESKADYDKIVPLNTLGDEYITQATLFSVICPTCGQHITKEIYKYGDQNERRL